QPSAGLLSHAAGEDWRRHRGGRAADGKKISDAGAHGGGGGRRPRQDRARAEEAGTGRERAEGLRGQSGGGQGRGSSVGRTVVPAKECVFPALHRGAAGFFPHPSPCASRRRSTGSGWGTQGDCWFPRPSRGRLGLQIFLAASGGPAEGGWGYTSRLSAAAPARRLGLHILGEVPTYAARR